MFRYLSDRTKAIIFYALAFIFSAAVVPLAPILGAGVSAVAMLTPLLAVLLLLLIVTRDGYTRAGWPALGLHRAGVGTWRAALFVPLLILGFSYGALWLTGIASFAMPVGHRSLVEVSFGAGSPPCPRGSSLSLGDKA